MARASSPARAHPVGLVQDLPRHCLHHRFHRLALEAQHRVRVIGNIGRLHPEAQCCLLLLLPPPQSATDLLSLFDFSALGHDSST
jgi:hypothetical protein